MGKAIDPKTSGRSDTAGGCSAGVFKLSGTLKRAAATPIVQIEPVLVGRIVGMIFSAGVAAKTTSCFIRIISRRLGAGSADAIRGAAAAASSKQKSPRMLNA